MKFGRNTWPASREFLRKVPDKETGAKVFKLVNMARVNIQPVEIKVFNMVNSLMADHREFKKVQKVLARIIKASRTGTREDVKSIPEVKYMRLAEELLFITAMIETDPVVKTGKLVGMDPVWSHGKWVTRGRLGGGMVRILGVVELPILLNTSRLAYLLMVSAHEEDHRKSKQTLWRSRSQAWIHKGSTLAKKVCRECMFYRVKDKDHV